jgi:hypothetical protein
MLLEIAHDNCTKGDVEKHGIIFTEAKGLDNQWPKSSNTSTWTVWKMKGPVLALLCLPPIAGCVMLLEIAHDNAHKGPLLAMGNLQQHHTTCDGWEAKQC